MNLICNKYEKADQQCSVIENGVQCNHGVRNRKRGLCSMHNARFDRNGHTTVILPKGGSLPKKIRMKRKEALQMKRQEQGLSLMCFCSHAFLKHHADQGCKHEGCKCKKFDGTNALTFYTAVDVATRLGFTSFLNDTAYCARCNSFIRVGCWYDQLAVGRMREHLKVHLMEGRKSAPSSATG